MLPSSEADNLKLKENSSCDGKQTLLAAQGLSTHTLAVDNPDGRPICQSESRQKVADSVIDNSENLEVKLKSEHKQDEKSESNKQLAAHERSDIKELRAKSKRRSPNKRSHRRKMDNSEAKKGLLANSQSGSFSSGCENDTDLSQASTSLSSSSVFGGASQASSLICLDETSENLELKPVKIDEVGGEKDKKENTLSGQNQLANQLKQDEEKENFCTLNKTNAVSRSMSELDKQTSSGQRFSVVWQNLDFTYRRGVFASALSGDVEGKNVKPVLKNISGHFRSNQLVAVIGPSGCGKTTLLQFLAGNESTQQDRLRIVGLDEPKVAFIGQDDALLPGLTARETLLYASRLQNTKRGFDHAKHVQPILNELGLEECSDRPITKLSGGQAKRVTIAQELLYPTNLLILDEVTSGLDASTSYSIVKLLKYLVSDSNYPMSIVMSIHQPSARLFSVFDRVYVMSEGYCLYEGSCQVSRINEYLGLFNLKCPKYHNIADYLIEIACSNLNSSSKENCDVFSSFNQEKSTGVDESSGEQSIKKTKLKMIEFQRKKNQDLLGKICNEHGQQAGGDYLVDPSAKDKDQSVSLLLNVVVGGQVKNGQVLGPVDDGPIKQLEADNSLYRAIERARSKKERPFWDQFVVHLKRSVLRIRRSWILTYLQFFTYILVALQTSTFYGNDIGQIGGCPHLPNNLMSIVTQAASTPINSNQNRSESETDIFSDQTNEDMRGIQENLNLLLVTVLAATFAALEITVITFPMEAKTVKREWRNGWYKVSSYFMGRTLADLPFSTLYVFVYSVLVYKLTGQVGSFGWHFVSFLAIVLMTALVAQSFGFIFGAIFMDNLPAAVFTAPMSIFPALLFSGFFARTSQIPLFYKPFSLISHFKYTFDALLVTLYGYDRCDCDQLALDNYHAGLRNQTESMRDMFELLLGCDSSASSRSEDPTTTSTTQMPPLLADNLINHEDLAAISASNSSLGALLVSTVAAQTSPGTMNISAPTAAPKNSIIEAVGDALTNTLFEQMQKNPINSTGPCDTLNTTGQASPIPVEDPEMGMSGLDRMSHRFSTHMVQMLGRQSNFGRTIPKQCHQFSSYLIQEYELKNQDLINSLLVLLVYVLITRFVCNIILNLTIARRAR